MNKIFTLFLFLSTGLEYSQSIVSYLNFTTESDFYSDKPVSEVTEHLTFYNTSGVKKEKQVTTYNKMNRALVELRYNSDNILKQRLTRLYDESNVRSTFRRFENFHPIIGRTVEDVHYQYDQNGFLISIVEKDEKGNIVRQSALKNDSIGNPVELIILIGDKIQSKETAEYFYDENSVVIHYYNRYNDLVNSVRSKIKATIPDSDQVLNEYGDIISSPTFEQEIKYDKFGNWIKKTYFEIENGKRLKKSEYARTIKYQK